MAGRGLDEDAARAVESGRETVGALLGTAQRKLQRVFIAFVVGLGLGVIAMRIWVWPTLKRDLLARGADVIAQTPFDVILLQVKLGLIVGVLVAIPMLLYYSRDPLRERGIVRDVPVAKWKVVLVALVSVALFVVGVIYAYSLFFPIMFGFLAQNALDAGFTPNYSIVMWTQFILVLGLSFGLAAQLPLAMTALSYSGVVPYETFRDNWKYAILVMFVFGAVFSPPDPFTQILWAAPLVMLYGVSLYLSKLVVTAKRGRAGVDLRRALRTHWNRVAGSAVLAGGLAYGFFAAGGVELVNRGVLARIPASVRPGPLPPVETALGLSRPTAVAVVAVALGSTVAFLVLLYAVYRSVLEAAENRPLGVLEGGVPEGIDLAALDEAGVRAAPPEAFAALTEEDALERARAAMDADRPETARAILDRFDEVQEAAESDDSDAPDAEAADGEESRFTTRTAAGVVSAFTEEERTEDDIGGYYYDIAFVLDSLRSRVFRIFATFMTVLVGSFWFLYSGGFGRVRADFLSRVPAEVATDEPLRIVTLHPVEALIFMVKFSTLLAAIVILPLVVYYAWPALHERGLVRGGGRVLGVWGGAILVGVVAGSAVGYLYVAPHVISWLVLDAIDAGMVISYRLNNFFWLVFLTTAGIGLLADIPVTMLLFYRGRLVSYRAMRGGWRGVALAAFVFAALVTPSSLYTMLLVGIPIVLAYWLGLGALWVITLGGRRDIHREDVAPSP